MDSKQIREKYIKFFVERGHKEIAPAKLVPENDPTVLFNSAGMQPLVPYFLGQSHPAGKRLTDAQKCLRTDDIDEVGDKVHHTFFEMLGNWSLGDYFKEEAIKYSFEFLTSAEWLNIPLEELAVSVFAGDGDAPFDETSYKTWLSLEIPQERMAKLPKKNNWWGPAGKTGPCGPDTEMFIWTGEGKTPVSFDPDDPNWVEVWNDVFMEYNKTKEGTFEKLNQQNVDTGMGLERMLAVINGTDDDYKTDLFLPIIQKIEKISGKKYADNLAEFRIIADHLKAAVFLILDGVIPSNKTQGYILRRLLRRSMVKMHSLSGKVWNAESLMEIIEIILKIYDGVYNINAEIDQEKVETIITDEMMRFAKTLNHGLKEFNKLGQVTGKDAFDLFQTFGFPLELTQELAEKKEIKIKKTEFEEEFKKHQEQSRTASAGMFKGGLADNSEVVTKYHTATHLLHQALRDVLGSEVFQKGSNITSERLRFDFSFDRKMSDEEIKKVEDLVNQKITEDLIVTKEVVSQEEARKMGAIGLFNEKYGDEVSVYSIGDFSKEICGGPHVKHTGVIGNIKIIKEEAVSAGIRRIRAEIMVR